jgi:3-dehydroquinate synthase
MVAACRIAVIRRLITGEQEARVKAILSTLHLGVRWADLPSLPAQARDAATLKDIMLHDKKALAGVVRFVLPVGLGDAAVFSDVTAAEIDAGLSALDE